MEFRNQILKLLDDLIFMLDDQVKLLPIGMQTLIMAEMGVGSPDDAWRSAKPSAKGAPDVEAYDIKNTTFSKFKQLQNRSGAFIKSFNSNVTVTGLLGSTMSVEKATSFERSGYVVSGTFGTNFPDPHEKGGFIPNKGKMHKFFWACWFASKNNYFKIMALASKKNKGINIPARPHFEPAVDSYAQTGAEKNLMNLLMEIERAWRQYEQFA